MAVSQSAKALVDGFLAQYGLQGLAAWAWNRYKGLGGGADALQIIQFEMVDRPEFQARFPAYKELAAKGRAMSPAEMLAYERAATQILRANGIPEGFYDSPDDFAGFLRNEVSVAELQQRVTLAAQAASGPSETKDALRDLYGVTEGVLTAFYLDPDRALPVIQRQFQAASLSGAAARTGFGALTAGEAERLVSVGVEDAERTFGQLAADQPEVLGRLAGERETDLIGRESALAAVEGNRFAQERIARKRRQRTAAFEGGSGFALGREGVSALTPAG